MTPARYQVAWTEGAVRDLEEITTWIAQDSPPAARRLLQRLRERAATLTSTPLRGRVVPELSKHGVRGFRELVVRPYRLMYRVEGKRVYVLCVLDARRDLEDVLLERLVRL